MHWTCRKCHIFCIPETQDRCSKTIDNVKLPVRRKCAYMIKWHVLCTGNVKLASSVHFRKIYISCSVFTYADMMMLCVHAPIQAHTHVHISTQLSILKCLMQQCIDYICRCMHVSQVNVSLHNHLFTHSQQCILNYHHLQLYSDRVRNWIV